MSGGSRQQGQGLVEFALVLPVFLALMLGVFDLGRGIYMYNGVSEAAREIARADSVHACDGLTCSIGTSPETVATVNTQKALIPNLGNPTFTCVDIDGSAISGTCGSGNWVKVTITAPYSPVTPVLGLVGTWNMTSSSSVQIP